MLRLPIMNQPQHTRMANLIGVFGKHGLSGLVILALFFMLITKSNSEESEHQRWHDDIKANTQAVSELTNRLSETCRK